MSEHCHKYGIRGAKLDANELKMISANNSTGYRMRGCNCTSNIVFNDFPGRFTLQNET